MEFIGIISIIGFMVFFILLIINMIRKKSKKISIVGLLVCFILFVVALALTPDNIPEDVPAPIAPDTLTPAPTEEITSKPIELQEEMATSKPTSTTTESPQSPSMTQTAESLEQARTNIKDSLMAFELNDREIQAVIDTMVKVSENQDLNAYTYELEKGKTPVPDIEMKDSQPAATTINIMDYMGLKNEHAYSISDAPSSSPVREHLGEGTVDGINVYAIASYSDFSSIGQGLELKDITLYQLEGNSLYNAGKIEDGKVTWSTDFLKREYPLKMDVGKIYDFTNNEDSTGLYLKRTYEVLGFKEITINGKQFNDCVELQQIDELVTPAGDGSGTVTSYTWYYAKDFGYVYFKLNTVHITSNADKPISIYVSSGHYIEGIDGKQLASPNDFYPFTPIH